MHPELTPLDPWIARMIGATGRLTRGELERYQLDRLRETLRYVRERSPFYRSRLAGAPQDLQSLADLADLPFTTPQDIRENPLRFVCVSQDAIQRIVTLDSSGTTGAPKRIAFTTADQELTLDFFQVGMSTFTAPSDTVLILFPAARPGSVGDLLATALGRLGARAIPHGPGADPQEAITALVTEHANIVVGTPTQVLALARHPAGQGLRLKSVLLTADHVPNAIVCAVEQTWGCVVYNHYGMTEMGLGGGVECQARRGYHLREADLLVEIIDPSNGRPVAEGQDGEVVFTTLTRAGMPLIRYRTGDLSRFLPGGCPCGTTLRALERVTTRIDGIVHLAGGQRLTIADLDEALFPIAGLIGFTATLATAARDLLQIDLVLAPGAPDPRPAAQAALDGIPALQHTYQAGRLDLRITLGVPQPDPISRLAKRAIVRRT